MNSVGTLLPEFDTRLKGEQYFNTAKYPTATFKSTKIERAAANGLRVSGELTFLGVTKPAVLNATFFQAGPGKGWPASWFRWPHGHQAHGIWHDTVNAG